MANIHQEQPGADNKVHDERSNQFSRLSNRAGIAMRTRFHKDVTQPPHNGLQSRKMFYYLLHRIAPVEQAIFMSCHS